MCQFASDQSASSKIPPPPSTINHQPSRCTLLPFHSAWDRGGGGIKSHPLQLSHKKMQVESTQLQTLPSSENIIATYFFFLLLPSIVVILSHYKHPTSYTPMLTAWCSWVSCIWSWVVTTQRINPHILGLSFIAIQHRNLHAYDYHQSPIYTIQHNHHQHPAQPANAITAITIMTAQEHQPSTTSPTCKCNTCHYHDCRGHQTFNFINCWKILSKKQHMTAFWVVHVHHGKQAAGSHQVTRPYTYNVQHLTWLLTQTIPH